MFNGMRFFLVEGKNAREDDESKKRTAIHVDHQRLVGARGIEIVPDRFLGGNVLGLFVESECDGFDERDG